MTSKSNKTESIRERKRRRGGAKRKAKLENHGSTKSAEELFRVQKA